MKFVSLGVVASAFIVICVSGNQFNRFEAGLVNFEPFTIPQSQSTKVQANSIVKKSRLSRRKLVDTFPRHSHQFSKRGNEKQESDEHEKKENEANENEADESGYARNKVSIQAYVSKDNTSDNHTENEVNEIEPSENESSSLEDEFKEPQEDENEPKENEPKENEPKENEPKENEQEPREIEPQENEHEPKENEHEPKENKPKENEPKENEHEHKEQEPEENELGVIVQAVKELKVNENNNAELPTGSKPVLIQDYKSSSTSNRGVNKQEKERNISVINKLDVVNGLYGDASEDDLVYYGLKDPASNDEIKQDTNNIAHVFNSPPDVSLLDNIPYEYTDTGKKTSNDIALSSTEIGDINIVLNDPKEDMDLGNTESPLVVEPHRVDYDNSFDDLIIGNTPTDFTEKDNIKLDGKSPKALQKEPGFSYSVSGHEVYADDNDEFESLEDRMEKVLGLLYNNKYNSQDDETTSELHSSFRSTVRH